jgi:hypothetical protein
MPKDKVTFKRMMTPICRKRQRPRPHPAQPYDRPKNKVTLRRISPICHKPQKGTHRDAMQEEHGTSTDPFRLIFFVMFGEEMV